MDGGQSAAFARHISVAKGTIHHWLKGDGTPKLSVSLKIAAHCGLSLVELLTGNLAGWQPPVPEQRVLALPQPAGVLRCSPRTLNWKQIEAELQAFLILPTPISVLEAARRLTLEALQLYLRANRTTRQLGERWKTYFERRHEDTAVKAWPYLETACRDIWAEGKAVPRREVRARAPAEILSPVAHLLDVLKEMQAHLQNAGPVGEMINPD